MHDVWQVADSYETYIGRWSRPAARTFVSALAVPSAATWIDVGCGSGAVTAAILGLAEPARVVALDRSVEFVARTDRMSTDRRASFLTADATSLPLQDRCADAVVSGLVLNFVPDVDLAAREMLRCAKPGGIVATYLWDYAAGMQVIRLFWDAAIACDPPATQLDEAVRFPLCRPDALHALFSRAGAVDVEVTSITVPTPFRDFDDLWTPFLGGQGPAPAYAVSLGEEERQRLREELRRIVPANAGGSIDLSAKAWFVRARR